MPTLASISEPQEWLESPAMPRQHAAVDPAAVPPGGSMGTGGGGGRVMILVSVSVPVRPCRRSAARLTRPREATGAQRPRDGPIRPSRVWQCLMSNKPLAFFGTIKLVITSISVIETATKQQSIKVSVRTCECHGWPGYAGSVA